MSLSQKIKKAIKLANKTGITINFSFNGIKMTIAPNSILEDEIEKFNAIIKKLTEQN